MKTYPMISFRCDEDLQRIIKREAKRQNISIGELIRRALDEHVKTPQSKT